MNLDFYIEKPPDVVHAKEILTMLLESRKRGEKPAILKCSSDVAAGLKLDNLWLTASVSSKRNMIFGLEVEIDEGPIAVI